MRSDGHLERTEKKGSTRRNFILSVVMAALGAGAENHFKLIDRLKKNFNKYIMGTRTTVKPIVYLPEELQTDQERYWQPYFDQLPTLWTLIEETLVKYNGKDVLVALVQSNSKEHPFSTFREHVMAIVPGYYNGDVFGNHYEDSQTKSVNPITSFEDMDNISKLISEQLTPKPQVIDFKQILKTPYQPQNQTLEKRVK